MASGRHRIDYVAAPFDELLSELGEKVSQRAPPLRPLAAGSLLPRSVSLIPLPDESASAHSAGFGQPVMAPTIDTNVLGHCCTQVNAGSAPCQAMDGIGHLGHALQAGGRGWSPPSSTSERAHDFPGQ